jgi:hypothetical protein
MLAGAGGSNLRMVESKSANVPSLELGLARASANFHLVPGTAAVLAWLLEAT